MYKIISKTIQENLKYNTNKIYLMAGLRFATRCRKVENHVLSEISPLNSLIPKKDLLKHLHHLEIQAGIDTEEEVSEEAVT